MEWFIACCCWVTVNVCAMVSWRGIHVTRGMEFIPLIRQVRLPRSRHHHRRMSNAAPQSPNYGRGCHSRGCERNAICRRASPRCRGGRRRAYGNTRRCQHPTTCRTCWTSQNTRNDLGYDSESNARPNPEESLDMTAGWAWPHAPPVRRTPAGAKCGQSSCKLSDYLRNRWSFYVVMSLFCLSARRLWACL